MALTALGAVAAAVLPAGTAMAAPASDPVQKVIVVLDRAPMQAAVSRRTADVSRQYRARLTATFSRTFSGFAASMPASQVQALRRDPRVAGVYPDLPVRVSNAEVPAGVRRIGAEAVTGSRIGTRSDVDVDIAVLDTGVSLHRDLNVVGGVNCTTGVCLPGSYADGHGHGTHVAGTAAARDNGSGVVGTAPGARVWAVKVLDDNGSGSTSSIVAGFEWVAARTDIEVLNASLGGTAPVNNPMTTAARSAIASGVAVVVAAGNSNTDAAGFSPANTPEAITVSAYADSDGSPGGTGPTACGAADDARAWFSNYGSVVDVAAPGVCVLSTSRTGGYAYMSGTSMAAPHVAGAAAVYIATNGLVRSSTRNASVLTALRGSWGAAQTSPCGFSGGISAEPAVIMGGCPDTTPPTAVTLSGAAGKQSASLTWNASTDVSDIAAYRIVRTTGDGAFSERATLTADARSFTDTGLQAGIAHTYAVEAVDTARNVSRSNSVSIVPTAPDPTPDTSAPTAPVAKATSADGSVQLTWRATSDNVGVTAYEVRRAVGSAGTFDVVATVDGSSLGFLDSTVVNGTRYRYQVLARDLAGNVSPPSRTLAAAPRDRTAPKAVTVSVSAADSRVTVRWTAATDPSGIRSYRIRRSVGGSAFRTLRTVTGTALTYENRSLQADTGYRYQVLAIDRAGNISAASNIAAATTPATRVALRSLRYYRGFSASSATSAPVTVRLALASEAGAAVSGATVTVQLHDRRGVAVGAASAVTTTKGRAAVVFSAPKGRCYTAVITDVRATGRTWSGMARAHWVCL